MSLVGFQILLGAVTVPDAREPGQPGLGRERAVLGI
jgi:hypothetical protein